MNFIVLVGDQRGVCTSEIGCTLAVNFCRTGLLFNLHLNETENCHLPQKFLSITYFLTISIETNLFCFLKKFQWDLTHLVVHTPSWLAIVQ